MDKKTEAYLEKRALAFQIATSKPPGKQASYPSMTPKKEK